MSLIDLDIDSKLKILFNSKPTEYIKKFIRDYNEECKKKEQKDLMIKRYSQLNKYKLVEYVVNSLSEEYKLNLLKSIQKDYIKSQFLAGLDLIKGEKLPEKLIKAEPIEGLEIGYKFVFKGFSWETNIDILFTDDNKIEDFRCDCRIAQNGGLCQHFFAGLIYLIKDNKLDPNSLGLFFSLDKEDIKNIKKLENIDLSEGAFKKSQISKKIEDPVILEIAELNDKYKVSISDSKIESIEQKVSKYRDQEITWYLMKISGGGCKNPFDKEGEFIPFNSIYLRCSSNLMDRSNLKVGDVISFNGNLKQSDWYGMIIQNVRKITKSK
ncbi:MAG: hypothetical protein ACTSPY_01240 [Candidatus Helarchaeota archaeon]